MTTLISAATALKLLAKTDMRPFEEHNWHAYAGCQTKDPLFGYRHDEPGLGEVELVLDGATLLIVTHGNMDTGGQLFTLA